jgi:uncharacterized membrane protein YccC
MGRGGAVMTREERLLNMRKMAEEISRTVSSAGYRNNEHMLKLAATHLSKAMVMLVDTQLNQEDDFEDSLKYIKSNLKIAYDSVMLSKS